MGDILVHLRPIEALSDSLKDSKDTSMTEFFMGLIQYLSTEIWVEDNFDRGMGTSTFEEMASTEEELQGSANESLSRGIGREWGEFGGAKEV